MKEISFQECTKLAITNKFKHSSIILVEDCEKLLWLKSNSKQTSTKKSDIILFNTENLANGVYLINISNRNISISNTKIINIK